MIEYESQSLEQNEILRQKKNRTESILREVGELGAKNAASALSGLIQKEITIEVPSLNIVSPIEVPEILQSHGLQTVVIIEQLSRNLECDVILVFKIEEARKLVDILLETMDLGGIEEYQVLLEIGNILIGNFINALSDHTRIPLKPTPPTHMIDYFDAILDNYVTRLMFEEKNATLFDTRLLCSGVDIDGLLLMFLDDEFQESIVTEYNQ